MLLQDALNKLYSQGLVYLRKQLTIIDYIDWTEDEIKNAIDAKEHSLKSLSRDTDKMLSLMIEILDAHESEWLEDDNTNALRLYIERQQKYRSVRTEAET